MDTASDRSTRTDKAADPGSGVQSVDRALTILAILARLGEAGVTEIALELGVHKSTAFRLVATLESHGMVEQNEDRGKYRLGVGVLRLAAATTARLDVVQEARAVSRKLAADTGETVNIAVLAESSALYVDQVAGHSALPSHNWVGQHIPLHATSNGKLRQELEQVREQGYAVAVDELEVGLTAVAAPIRNAHGEVIASLSVSGPTFRIGEATVKELVPMVVDAAGEVSHRLGWGVRP